MSFATFRTLDPSIGRWLQVDPKGEALKGINPYNSMANNPISFNDPEGDIIPALIVGAAIGVATNGISNAVQGNNFFQGAGKAALFGAIGGGVSSAIGGAAAGMSGIGKAAFQMGAHGISGGIMSKAQGGSFGSGFLSGALSSGMSSGASTLGVGDIGMIGIGGLSGGIGSSIAGGSFWGGVGQGLLTSGLNHAAHNLNQTIQNKRWEKALNSGDYYHTYPDGSTSPHAYNPRAGEIANWTGTYDDNSTFKIQKMRSPYSRRVHIKFDLNSAIYYTGRNSWANPKNFGKLAGAGIMSRMVKNGARFLPHGLMIQGGALYLDAIRQQSSFYYGYTN